MTPPSALYVKSVIRPDELGGGQTTPALGAYGPDPQTALSPPPPEPPVPVPAPPEPPVPVLTAWLVQAMSPPPTRRTARDNIPVR